MRLVKPILALVALVAFVACANQQLKTPDQMSPKERGAFALTLYNNAFTNYNAQFVATPQPMSKESKEYFQGYKKVMEVAWPVISGYSTVVNVGGVPTSEQEQQLIQLIYQLQAMLMKGVQ